MRLPLLSLLLFPVAAYAAFPDVPASHPNVTAIAYVQAEGIVGGYPDGTYQPGRTINRAEFTKIIIGAISDPTGIDACSTATGFSGYFPDVPQGAWFEPYVCTARLLGLIEGYPDGTFKPERTINFVEAAKILAQAFELSVQADASLWYKGYVQTLGIQYAIPVSITGFDSPLTRGEMAEMVWRLHAQERTEASLTYEQLSSSRPVQNTQKECIITGCSNQLCVEQGREPLITTCEWKEEYACYRDARCERQNNGSCGWTQTTTLQSCLENTTEEEVSIQGEVEIGIQTSVEYSDYQEGVIGNGKQSLLFFHAPWCPYCRINDARLLKLYEERAATVSTYKIDYDSHLDLRSRYGIVEQDTFVLIDGQGNAIQEIFRPNEQKLRDLVAQ